MGIGTMKILVFTEMKWAMGRTHTDIAKHLPYEFEFIDWSNYNGDYFANSYTNCDVMVTNLVASRVLSHLDQKKILYISHGFEEHNSLHIEPSWNFGMVSDTVGHLFPKESKIFLTPNGVDPDNFDYKQRDGSLKTLGWCGAPNVWFKQPSWNLEISKKTGIPLRITSGIPCEDDLSKWTPLNYQQIREWYSTIDLLLITSIPEGMYETGPLPSFEAIASGVPVIGTPVGNFANIPGPKFKTVEEAVEIIKNMNPEKMKDLAKEQYAYVMKHYTYASFANKWQEAIEYVYSRSKND
jgi:hypothetical protein